MITEKDANVAARQVRMIVEKDPEAFQAKMPEMLLRRRSIQT